MSRTSTNRRNERFCRMDFNRRLDLITPGYDYTKKPLDKRISIPIYDWEIKAIQREIAEESRQDTIDLALAEEVKRTNTKWTPAEEIWKKYNLQD